MEIWPESLKGNQNIKPIHGSYIVGITVRQSKGLTQRCWIPCTLWVTSKLRKKQRCGSCHKEIISGTFKIIQEQRNLLPYNLDTHQKKRKKKTNRERAVIWLWNNDSGNNWLLTVTKHKYRAGETRGPPCSETAQSMFRQTSIRNCLTCYYRLLETGTLDPLNYPSTASLHWIRKCWFTP